jgi:hypothetical protein
MIDLMVAHLARVCGEPGCPACTARRQAERKYLEGLLWEGLSDGALRAKLKRSLGFCPDHAWALQATEDSLWRDGLGTARLYDDLAWQIVKSLEQYAADQTGRPLAGLRHWFTRLGQSLWLARWTAQLLAKLTPQQLCPVCQIGQGAEKRLLHTLLASYQTDEVWLAFSQSDGLCLPHLRQALARANRPAAAYLIDAALQKLRPLLVDLAEYQRKHAWQFWAESISEQEEEAWVRTVAFLAGEAETSAPETVQQRRRRALAIFHNARQPAEPEGDNLAAASGLPLTR